MKKTVSTFFLVLLGSSNLLTAHSSTPDALYCGCTETVCSTFSNVSNLKKDLILDLYRIGAVKIGEFKLKSGSLSPIYFDLRVIISYPEILKAVAANFEELAKHCSYDEICGVPYAALPMATALSLKTSKPLLMARKEAKDYGTKKMIEGVFFQGDHCIVVEDVITTGGSILDTVEKLENEGLVVKDVFVFVDREQGGKNTLINRGYRLHSICTSIEIVEILYSADLIDEDTYIRIKDYLFTNTIH